MSTTPYNKALSDDDQRTFAIVVHVLSLFCPLLAPLCGFLVFRHRGKLIDQHMRQALNFQLTIICWYIITGITVVGLILWPVLLIIAFVQIIKAAIAAGDNRNAAMWPVYGFVNN